MKRLLLAAAVACTVTACTPALATAPGTPTASPVLRQVNDPGHVTGTLAGKTCHLRGTRPANWQPDPRCTPGSTLSAVTQADIQQTICKRGWTATVRPPESQTEHAKWDEAEPAYGVSDLNGELDHLVPLELGGSNDLSNLWIEAGKIPNPKDRIEAALNAAVCSGRVTLAAAQQAIASGWITAEARLGL